MGKNADDIGLPTDFPIEPFQQIGGRDVFRMFVPSLTRIYAEVVGVT